MAALTSSSVTIAGLLSAPVAVAASDTIAEAQCGSNGVLLRVINGGASPDVVTITDPNTTVVGSTATNPTVTVTNATTKTIHLPRALLNSSGVITVAHSFTTTVTCEVIKAGF